jgi:curved DNA-binding protein CbpA
MALDPYRVLGLPPGASPADVKRAYRRLAKANHPDSAGATALPRFLEIQRAYETLTAVTWRPGMRRPAPAAPAEPWRAESTRARSTPGAQPPGADQPGARARARASGPAGGRAAPPGGTARGTSGAASGKASRPGAGSRPEGAPGRRRPSRKATFGSTSYDEAKEPSDTSWSGASWYGPSSGEYWRVNPREYADPRKHGPEYLAKAAARAAAAAERRARGAGAPDGSGSSGPRAATEEPAVDGAPSRPTSDRAAPEGRPWSGAGKAARTGDGVDDARQAPRPSRGPAWSTRPPVPGGGGSAGDATVTGAFGDWSFSPPALNLGPGMRRILRALIAWPPLGIAAAAAIGEATGCAAFEATCAAPADLYPWFAQAGIVLGLLALPGIARILAGGTIAVAVLAFPVAAVLTAGGANYDRTYGPAALISVLAVVWAAGVGAVLLRRAIARAVP